MHLTFDDHRVDLIANVVHAHVLAQRDLARFGIDFHRRKVSAMRVGEVLRVDCRFRLQSRLDTVRQVMCGEGLERDSAKSLRLRRVTLDMERALAELQVARSALELMGCDETRLLDKAIRSDLDRLAADRERTRAVGIHAVRRTAGISMHYLDVFDRDAEDAAGDLAPCGLVALAVR